MNLQESIRNDLDIFTEHSAEQSMRDDAQEILRYLSSLARASRYSSNGAGALVQKMEAITSFINDNGM